MISEKAKLDEGEEAVRRVLVEVFKNRKIGTKKLAYLTKLPVPVTAAVRKELESEELLARKDGALLTEKGEKFVKEQLGLVYSQKLTCPKCEGRTIQIPDEFTPIIEKLRKHCKSRPRPLPWLDQAYGTPETALLRALFMLERGDVEGRKIIFLGDDDFVSIAVGLLKAARKITVIDFDPRLLDTIKLVSRAENLDINCVEHDLKRPVPKSMHGTYDVVFTDPPYTIPGLILFVSRGITALQQRKSASLYLAFAHVPPEKALIMQRTLGLMGLTIIEQIPRFNIYEGAEMFANTTFLARLETTEKTKPLVTEVFDGKLYTGEITQTVRIYQCRCGERVIVGAPEGTRTIEDLKAKGCPKCGKRRGFRLVRRQKTKEALAKRLTLRNFRWTDFPSILAFEREIALRSFPKAPILEEEYHKQKLEKIMKNEPESVKVALLNDEIVGWLWLRTEKDRNTNERFGYVKSIIVKPRHRHQGFGRKLMEAVENYFLGKGIRRIDLIVAATNYEATLFFEEIGFEKEHSTMRKRLESQEK